MSDWSLGGLTLPVVAVGVSRVPARIAGSHTSLSGAQTVDVIAVKFSWTVPFGLLDDDDYDTLLQFLDGRQGVGPWTLVEPHGTYTVNLGGLTCDAPTEGWQDVTLTLQEA